MRQSIDDRLSIIASGLSTDAREAARMARQLRVRGMLFDVWSSNFSIPDLSLSGRREFRHTLSANDQTLVGLRMDLGAKGLSLGADVDRQIKRIDLALESAAGLEARLLCIDLGVLPQTTVAHKPKPAIPPQQAGLIIIPVSAQPVVNEPATAPQPDQAFISQVNSALTDIGIRADRYGTTIAFSSSLAGFASLYQALTAVNCPWFGIDLDPVAVLRDEWPRDEIFSTLGGFIRHIRARDALVGADRRTNPTPLGNGSTNWAEFLTMLDEAEYPGFISVDLLELSDRISGATIAVNHLRNVSK